MSGGGAVPIDLDDETWEGRLSDDAPLLVDFWAPWCAPCTKMEPTIRALAERYAGRMVVARLNVEDAPRTAGRYGVLTLPTVIMFRGGEPVARVAGAVKPAKLEAALAAHLPEPRP